MELAATASGTLTAELQEQVSLRRSFVEEVDALIGLHRLRNPEKSSGLARSRRFMSYWPDFITATQHVNGLLRRVTKNVGFFTAKRWQERPSNPRRWLTSGQVPDSTWNTEGMGSMRCSFRHIISFLMANRQNVVAAYGRLSPDIRCRLYRVLSARPHHPDATYQLGVLGVSFHVEAIRRLKPTHR